MDNFVSGYECKLLLVTVPYVRVISVYFQVTAFQILWPRLPFSFSNHPPTTPIDIAGTCDRSKWKVEGFHVKGGPDTLVNCTWL